MPALHSLFVSLCHYSLIYYVLGIISSLLKIIIAGNGGEPFMKIVTTISIDKSVY